MAAKQACQVAAVHVAGCLAGDAAQQAEQGHVPPPAVQRDLALQLPRRSRQGLEAAEVQTAAEAASFEA